MNDAVNNKIVKFVTQIATQFDNRVITEGKKRGINYDISLKCDIDTSNTLWLNFCSNNEVSSITIPLPYVENNIKFIKSNEVVRALCPFWLEKEQAELDYIDVMYRIALTMPVGFVSESLVKPTPYIQQVINGFNNNTSTIAIYKFQKAINEIINKMPLHETNMNSFVMNNRLMIIDTEFDILLSPEDRLKYQVEKTKKYHNCGWTSIGLSDGTLADKNYMLKVDLRTLSAFGKRYHNPQRNLYSTLSMKGDEKPIIVSNSMKILSDAGINRTGWNWFTAFVDVPEVFEDQILVDIIHKNKYISYEKRIQTFGQPIVNEGDKINYKTEISYFQNEEADTFDAKCDEAIVDKVIPTTVNVGGTETLAYNIIIKYKRYFCNGMKITNMHGNKGIIQMKDLGYAINPITGKKRKIDVIVSAKTIGKRKNYGQVLEVLTNNILEYDNGTENLEQVVIDDNWFQLTEEIEAGLQKRGFNVDGTWECHTHVGKIKAVSGNIFWGCIKTPHDQLWEENATFRENTKGIRTAGLKFSHVEFRALETRFGENNSIIDEIMSWSQGASNINELIKMLKTKKGEFPSEDTLLLDSSTVIPVDQNNSTIIPGHCISGSVVDEFFNPNGFMFKLPLPFVTLLDEKGESVYEGSKDIIDNGQQIDYYEGYMTDRVFIPSGSLRKCWKHGSGKYGLSELGVVINNLVSASHKLLSDPSNVNFHKYYYYAITNYYNRITSMLCSKRGEISNCAMSVRYPYSAKAVAALNVDLPKNVIEIHQNMARILKVNNGDYVLVERFPCLGFMSLRIQKVKITKDPLKKYVISASGNSLVSQNLDFDGDVIYVASFHTAEARKELEKEWLSPNEHCIEFIKSLNERKGAPTVKEINLQEYDIKPFNDLTIEEHANILCKNTGVKAQTGPVIALTYNIMRLVENSNLAKDRKMKVAVEMFLEKAAQSVFEQKHGGKSLYEIVIDGICTADVEMLVEVGFNRVTTEKLCKLIIKRAASIGVNNLSEYHIKAKKKGVSNIISKIVRLQNKIYFASRSSINAIKLLNVLEGPAVDIPSKMFKYAMNNPYSKITETNINNSK